MDKLTLNVWLMTADNYMNSGKYLSMPLKAAEYVAKFYNVKFISPEIGTDNKYLIVSKKEYL